MLKCNLKEMFTLPLEPLADNTQALTVVLRFYKNGEILESVTSLDLPANISDEETKEMERKAYHNALDGVLNTFDAS